MKDWIDEHNERQTKLYGNNGYFIYVGEAWAEQAKALGSPLDHVLISRFLKASVKN